MNGRAFSEVCKLKSEIEQHLTRAVDNECGEMLKHVHKQVLSLDELSKITLNTDLDEAIAEKADQLSNMFYEIEDSKSEIKEDAVIKNIKEEIDSFMISNELKMKEKECNDGLYNVSLIDDVVQDEVSSEVIGVSEVYQQLKHQLMRSRPKVTSLVGMAGIGKTTLANKLFNDPTVVESFDHRLWIRVGKRYRANDIPRLMLQQMGLQMIPEGDKEAIRQHLKSERYLIVLDDVWDRFTLHLLCSDTYRAQTLLTDESGSRILITSRLLQLNQHRRELEYTNIIMRLLNREESWDLLCGKVFCQGSCPPQLMKVGMKISNKCAGLPLTILAVARLLSQLDDEDKCNPEYWEEVATKNNHPIFMEAYDEISKVLLSSYTFLPPLLQMCFMFIGLFPPKYEIPRSTLLNLWLSDGFFELNVHISSEESVFECLEELLSNSVVMIYQKSSFNWEYTVKTCGLHSSFWHLSKNLAHETKFALILSSRNEGLGDGIDGYHRVSFINNVLFGIKDVHKSVENNCASAARSLFCFGPYHQYQVPLCFRLKLLKELDAISIRFYEFPMEVLKLVQLGYLSLTVNEMIPASISQLQLLEFLIVDRHQSIKSCKDASYLPVEIWNLQKLKHLQVMGCDLPDPPRGASMSNLLTLSDVSVHSCTNAVLKGVPMLRSLKVVMELAPDDDSKPFICFGADHFSYLDSLKCVIVNPESVPPVAPFLSSLKGANITKLSLSGLGYPWKEMRNIASLENLEVLKLKNYAFQGPEWEVEEETFGFLESLVIEDTDLVDWKIGNDAFHFVRSLRIKHCYKLQKIHENIFSWLQRIEVVDCNPCCIEEFKKIMGHCAILDVHSSWEDEKLKT